MTRGAGSSRTATPTARQALRSVIRSRGNVVWREQKSHHKGSSRQLKMWGEFFEKKQNPTNQQVLETRDAIETSIWHNFGDIPSH